MSFAFIIRGYSKRLICCEATKKSPLERGGTIVPGCVASENLFKHPQKNNKKGVKSKSFSVATHPAAKAAPLSRGEFGVRNPFHVVSN